MRKIQSTFSMFNINTSNIRLNTPKHYQEALGVKLKPKARKQNVVNVNLNLLFFLQQTNILHQIENRTHLLYQDSIKFYNWRIFVVF